MIGTLSGSKSSDWLFPMSETSAAAGRCYTLLICTQFHGPEVAHSSFRQGDYRAGQMASRMHLGTAVAAAHSSPQQTPATAGPSAVRFKTTQRLPENEWSTTDAQVEAIRWHWELSLGLDRQLLVAEFIYSDYLLIRVHNIFLFILHMKQPPVVFEE